MVICAVGMVVFARNSYRGREKNKIPQQTENEQHSEFHLDHIAILYGGVIFLILSLWHLLTYFGEIAH